MVEIEIVIQAFYRRLYRRAFEVDGFIDISLNESLTLMKFIVGLHDNLLLGTIIDLDCIN